MPDVTSTLDSLKASLAAADSKVFENLTAALIGELLGVSISVAKTGFQHGADAGTVGRQGRRLRLECKRYADTTTLSDRELLGEIDHAMTRDASLEAWFLIATREVSEQLAHDLVSKGERLGVPVVIIDWQTREVGSLAALCSSKPSLVGQLYSPEAEACASAVADVAKPILERLRRDLQAWCLGYEALREKSHAQVQAIWTSPQSSQAELGQDAAGGMEKKKVRRDTIGLAFHTWWQSDLIAPAAVIGWEGVGKTWSVLEWITDTLAEQPVVLVVPASACLALNSISEVSLRRFLAARLYNLTGIRDEEHWVERLKHLLTRPKEEGPVFTILLDGLNQETSVKWLNLLKALQGPSLAGRLRVITTTRLLHFEDQLNSFRGLIVPGVRIPVGPYDDRELATMLTFEGLKPDDLHPELLELARTPRLFRLVVRLKDRQMDASGVTVHRLLWEYGRDSLGVRTEQSFSEHEWRAWLMQIAKDSRAGIESYRLKTLAESTSRPDLSTNAVSQRLSDIIDGRFAVADEYGQYRLDPTIVAHCLGVALLATLQQIPCSGMLDYTNVLNTWLDPFASLDQRGEILRAAVSIQLEKGDAEHPVTSSLVLAWLQSQNLADTHRLEVGGLAAEMPNALLDTAEQSRSHGQYSARVVALAALRAIPHTCAKARTTIINRIVDWLSIVSLERNPYSPHVQSEKERAERLWTRIGLGEAGEREVLGLRLTLVDWDDGRLQTEAISLLEGRPLEGALACFEAAAIVGAARGTPGGAWNSLKWLCYLNEMDPTVATAALRRLSFSLANRTPEKDVHKDIPARAAALVLWLSGHEEDELAAADMNPEIDRHTHYEEYLANPGRGMYAVERRHANQVLTDRSLPVYARLQSTKDLWLDPTFHPAPEFVEELRKAASTFNVQALNSSGSYCREDNIFEELEAALARSAPDVLDALLEKKLLGFQSRSAEARYWSASNLHPHMLLADSRNADAVRYLRTSANENDKDAEAIAAIDCLAFELTQIDNAVEQFKALVDSAVHFFPTAFESILLPPSTAEVDRLIAHYEVSAGDSQRDLVILLSIHPTVFSERAWTYLWTKSAEEKQIKGVVFRTLARANPQKFGRQLVASNWTWSPKQDNWVNHYGSEALIAAEVSTPFEQIATRIAPWFVLKAARQRGEDRIEVDLAAEIFGRVLLSERAMPPEIDATIYVRLGDQKFPPAISSAKPNSAAGNDVVGLLKEAQSPEARRDKYMLAYDFAQERIDETRAQGAGLYLEYVAPEDMVSALRHARDAVTHWISGHEECSASFIRRVRLAEVPFLALCEALLTLDPANGVALWNSLRGAVVTRYLGPADIEEMLHIVFRVPESPEVIALRNDILGLRYVQTDLDLLNVSAVALYYGKANFLATSAQTDSSSDFVWKQRRGDLLDGLVSRDDLPIEGAWPAMQLPDRAHLRVRAARFAWSNACARYWWKVFLEAVTPIDAYSAWVLFIKSADVRAYSWIWRDRMPVAAVPLLKQKWAHFINNKPRMQKSMEKRHDRLGRKFLDHDVEDELIPWSKQWEHYGT